MVQPQQTHRPPSRSVVETYVNVTAATYTAKGGDRLIGVNRAGTVTITLPTTEVRKGRTYTVKDESGAAATNNITVATEGAETIDGSATDTISTDYGSVTYYSDGANWFTVPLLAVASHTLASHSAKAHSDLSDAPTSAHHTKYTDAEAVTQAKTVKLDDFTAPDDNTDLDASATKHGLLLKLGGGSTNFLRADGTWNAPGGGGQLTLIGTVVASNDATLTITGLDSTYDTYMITLADLLPATNTVQMYMRVGDSGGIDSGASDYQWTLAHLNSGNTVWTHFTDDSDSLIRVAQDIGNQSSVNGVGGVLFLHRPGDGTLEPFFSGQTANHSSGLRIITTLFAGNRSAVITLDRVQIFMSSGNITSGRMTVFGIAHA